MNRNVAAVFLIALFHAHVAISQETAETQTAEKPPAEITGMRIESAGSGGSPWTRVLVDFRCRPKWIDGLQVSMTVLVGDGTEERPYVILSGMARYINVPRGSSTGVLFISPSTTKRYGAVTAAQASIYVNDQAVSTFDYEGSGRAPEDWQSVYDRREGALLPITATPWVVAEYDKYPDSILSR
jgi:hypothetical protein